MTEASRAVFLSYASQDSEAARRICEALRAAGIEVWFDQSELRGGDAWDRGIRNQIHDCVLFVPIISASTQARPEGYFRLEWRLAVERTHLMSERIAFLVPVVIDATRDQDADVPDAFKVAQWTRLPAGESPPAFVERIALLLAPNTTVAPDARSAPIGAPAAVAYPLRRESPPTAVVQARSRQLWTKALLVAAGFIVLAIGYVALRRSASPKPEAVSAPPTPSSVQAGLPAPSAIPEKSIAVLPFVNMSSDKEQEYFSDGLSEELIDMLSKVSELRVPARTSSFYFKGKSETIDAVAKQLRVAHLLEGSVRKAGGRLRVTAQLIRADNGYHLWSETYDRDAKDIFKVQDEIASAVVEALKVKLAPTQHVSSHRSSNTEAYNEYLLGRQLYERAGDADGFRHAVDAFHKAIALDPLYAAAFAALALSEGWLADWSGDGAGLQQAEADAERAIALAPEAAEGYAVRGYVRYSFSWDWTGAQADLAKALQLDPASVEAQRQYARLMGFIGRLPEALAAEKKAIELDPLSNKNWEDLGRWLMFSRDYPAADRALRRSLEIQPDYSYSLIKLVTLQLLEGQAAEALATARKITFEPLRLQGVGTAEYSLGHAKESQQALDELIAKLAKVAAYYQIAEVLAWRGEKDKAFEWLDRAYAQRDGGLTALKYDPLLDSLHGDPRYKALLRKLNFPE